MLTDAAFEQWCHQLALSEQARQLIARIRSSPPSRLVQGRAGNVSGRYPSQKMRCTIQFESRSVELALIYQLEYDPAVLAFYDQPGAITLAYQNRSNTRRVIAKHTPDFFVLREASCGWIECKTEEHLAQLTKHQPHRYVPTASGTWRCPPGEAYAEQFGLFYRVYSSGEIDWTYQRNLRFLEEYLRGPYPGVPEAIVTSLRTMVMSMPGISLLDLLRSLHGGTADDVYFLIATSQVYVDLARTPLADPEHVQVFLDREIAEASAIVHAPNVHQLPRPFVLSIAEGTRLCWDGKPWTILNVGETAVTLLSEDRRVKPLPHEVFEMLLQQGMLTGIPSHVQSDRQEEQKRLSRASPKHLEVATERYRALGKHTSMPGERQVSLRTIQRWKASVRRAEAVYGNGYVGLLPNWGNCGNRVPRLPEEAEKLLEHFISEHYESLRHQPKKEVYLLLEREAEQHNIPVPSYTTFLLRIKRHSPYEQTLKREGPRAAAAVEPWVWELEQTTPRHGERPWDVVHLDHTQLDIGLVSARTGRYLGKPWATFMTDAFSRRLPVVYLTFDPPSYRSCLMALRECVWRYGRLPQTIVVDGGPDFRSTYFETLLAYYGCTKATRPWTKPRYGSVCERLFGTANTQFVHNLIGNTQIMKQVRQVTKALAPREQAVWTLGDLYVYLACWASEVYDLAIHPALGMSPRQAFTTGLLLGGERAHLKILYNDDFRLLSLATTRKRTAQVEPGRGVRINYLYYWAEALRSPSIERTQVPVRYDPFDIGTAYAYVQGRWVQCRSEHYLQLRSHSERELQIASAELRKRSQNHRGETAITAKRLADLLASAQAHEEVLMQRLQDLEARDVLAQMGGYRLLQEEHRQISQELMPTVRLPERAHSTNGILASPDQPVDEEEEDFSNLEEYEEYR
jgi:putative transposase